MANKISKGNILNIYFEANAFRNGFNDKFKKIKSNEYQGIPQDEQPIPYCVTLLTFACELYLKFLICMQKLENDKDTDSVESVKGHKLIDLFEKLSDKHKNYIANSLPINQEELVEELKRISDDFVTWRYMYESPKDNIVMAESIVKYKCNYPMDILEVLWQLSKKVIDETDIMFENTVCIGMEGMK